MGLDGAIALQTLEDLAPALGHGKPWMKTVRSCSAVRRQRPALGRRRRRTPARRAPSARVPRRRPSSCAFRPGCRRRGALRRGPRADGGHVQRVVAERAREELRRRGAAREPLKVVCFLVAHGSRCRLGGGILHRRRGVAAAAFSGVTLGPACGLLHRALRAIAFSSRASRRSACSGRPSRVCANPAVRHPPRDARARGSRCAAAAPPGGGPPSARVRSPSRALRAASAPAADRHAVSAAARGARTPNPCPPTSASSSSSGPFLPGRSHVFLPSCPRSPSPSAAGLLGHAAHPEP